MHQWLEYNAFALDEWKQGLALTIFLCCVIFFSHAYTLCRCYLRSKSSLTRSNLEQSVAVMLFSEMLITRMKLSNFGGKKNATNFILDALMRSSLLVPQRGKQERCNFYSSIINAMSLKELKVVLSAYNAELHLLLVHIKNTSCSSINS